MRVISKKVRLFNPTLFESDGALFLYILACYYELTKERQLCISSICPMQSKL